VVRLHRLTVRTAVLGLMIRGELALGSVTAGWRLDHRRTEQVTRVAR
jgi:hypothetical protein